MKSIQTNAIITSVRCKVDGSLGLSLSTPELSTEEKVAVMSYQGVNSIVTIQPLDEPTTDTLEIKSKIDGKSPSQRLRAVLYILYTQQHKDEPFEYFYDKWMNNLIEQLKDKIED